jgi:NADPH:quinone reductase-like Zn-dependent oxidoreductase
MRAVQLTAKTGYSGLRLTERYEPNRLDDGQVLVTLAAAGVTPLEHTLATGGLPASLSLPLVMGNEGAGVVSESRHAGWAVGTHVAFTGPYGMSRDGSWADAAVVDAGHLARVPEDVPLVTAAAMPVAYLTASLALEQAGFSAGKTVLAPGAGGSVGNATYQLARAMGAGRVITTAGSGEKAAAARAAGMTDVIDLSIDDLAAAARALTGGAGVDIVIDALGGSVTSSCLAALGFGGVAIVIGYSAGRTSAIRLTDLIWTASSVRGFNLFMQPPSAIRRAYEDVFSLLERGEINPAIDRVHPLEEAAAALEHLIEDRPFGKVVLSIEPQRV